MSTTTTTDYQLLERSIDNHRPMKVVVIGAGFSGIIAAIRFPQYIKNLELVVYEKEKDIGGTWCVNKYPGLACDIPSHCYQLTFEPNPNWSSFYSPGPEIHAYLKSVVDKYKLMPYIRLSHRITRAEWNSSRGKWELTISSPTNDGEELKKDEADFVLSGMGGLSVWDWPDIKGLRDFEGLLLHSANWDTDLGLKVKGEGEEKWKDKKVAVIGVGSSGIQIVPALQPLVKKVVNYVRGKTWIATPFASKYLLERQPDGSNHVFTEEEKKQFRDDPEYYFNWRKELETELNSVHGATLKDHEMQKGAVFFFKELMIQKLAKKPWIAEHIVPDFPVACRRLTPGPGYLEALCAENVDFVPTPISHFTKTGIMLTDGQHEEFDVIVCATGYDTTFKPTFPIVGKGGLDMKDARDPMPKSYLTMANVGFPNWIQTLGPNGAIGSGSLLVMIEKEVDYAVKMVKKLQKERYKSMEVKQEAVDDFEEYIKAYFPRTVYGQKCRSWYKMGREEGHVSGLWPGSCLHAINAFMDPRWEDFNYEPLDEGVKNRFYYLGNGWSENEKTGEGSRSWYLDKDFVDVPPVPE